MNKLEFYVLNGTIKLLISQRCVIFYPGKNSGVVKNVKHFQVVIL